MEDRGPVGVLKVLSTFSFRHLGRLPALPIAQATRRMNTRAAQAETPELGSASPPSAG